MPLTEIDSLTVHGTPRNGGSSPPALTRASAASASASASTKRSHASAFVRGWRGVQAVDVRLHHLTRGDLAAADRGGEVGGAAEREGAVRAT